MYSSLLATSLSGGLSYCSALSVSKLVGRSSCHLCPGFQIPLPLYRPSPHCMWPAPSPSAFGRHPRKCNARVHTLVHSENMTQPRPPSPFNLLADCLFVVVVVKYPYCLSLLLARPSAPSGFRIIRPVNHDAMLVGWTLPEMDEFGRSNGLTVKGYKASKPEV